MGAVGRLLDDTVGDCDLAVIGKMEMALPAVVVVVPIERAVDEIHIRPGGLDSSVLAEVQGE